MSTQSGWMPLVPAGEFQDKATGGVIVIDLPGMEAIQEAFEQRAKGDDGFMLPIGYDGSEFTGAAGWIRSVVARADGLWARVKWTGDGNADVTGANYRFLEPEFSGLESLGGGRQRPTQLAGGRLTNRPSLPLAPIPPVGRTDPPAESLGAVVNALGLPPGARLSAVLNRVAEFQSLQTERQKLAGALGLIPTASPAGLLAEAIKARRSGDQVAELSRREAALRNRVAALEGEIAGARAQRGMTAAGSKPRLVMNRR